MLYKKYHRNFVKQFKKGVKFNVGCRSFSGKFRVTREPSLDPLSSRIYIEDGKLYTWTLMYVSGRINKYLHVIQEISQKLC